MRITIHFMGQARVAAGCERTTVEVAAGSLVRTAVETATEQLGAALRSFLFHDDGQPRRSLLLVVGSRQVTWEDAEPLCDGESVTILPPIAGGAGP